MNELSPEFWHEFVIALLTVIAVVGLEGVSPRR